MVQMLRILALWLASAGLWAADTVTTPFRGVTHIYRTGTAPRDLHIHIVRIDLDTPGLRFKLTPPGGSRETVRQTTVEFLRQEHAQVAVNAHFFMPYPSAEMDSWLVGYAASEGKVFSDFESPEQSYAILANAPAIALDRRNRAVVVRQGRRPGVMVWTAVSGSAQIVTEGVKTIPRYGEGELTPGGPGGYSDAKSWYDAVRARTAIGLTRDGGTLVLFTVDERGGSGGMTVGEVAEMLIRDGVFDALNLDGGGSTSLAMQDPATGEATFVNVPTDPKGRAVASSLALIVDP
jgi:exopolysaccharide biosynthesis protein